MAGEIEHPHDRLFRAVFSDAKETADLLRSALPRDVSDKVHWDSLRLIDGTFIDDALRESETDLLFEAGYGDKVRPVRLYLLFEHQSTPDAWMPFRLLKYCLPHLGCGTAERARAHEIVAHPAVGIVPREPGVATFYGVRGPVPRGVPGMALGAQVRTHPVGPDSVGA